VLGICKGTVEIKSGACGTVIRNAEMKIVDPETGTSLPRNQAGEICIRGSQIMKGMCVYIYIYIPPALPLLLFKYINSIIFCRKIVIN
jgi:hypothetical protein